MTDQAILQLFQERDERAIQCADQKYGRGCMKIARDILKSPQDAEEAVNDMWIRVWDAIPPAKPENLFAFLSATVRNCALNRVAAKQTQKRGNGQQDAVLDELAYCVPSDESVEDTVDAKLLLAAVERFLDSLSSDARTIFVERYTNLKSVTEIAEEFRITESKVKVTLMRVRKKLRTFLKKEGWL